MIPGRRCVLLTPAEARLAAEALAHHARRSHDTVAAQMATMLALWVASTDVRPLCPPASPPGRSVVAWGSTKPLAEYAGVSPRTIRRWRAKGRLA